MTDAVRHRGPDGDGHWLDIEVGVALGHRRLAIIDLSPLGRQPMLSQSGRFVVSFNGEIYNFLELKRELGELPEPPGFVSASDTEVILAACECWGVRGALQRCVGMFALAVWDRQLRCLYLARDRIGEKPLYYGWVGDTFLFGSELKSLRCFQGFNPNLNRDAVALLLRHSYIPAPHTIYAGIQKLPPAGLLTLDLREARPEPRLEHYWSLHNVAEDGLRHPFDGSEKEALAELDRLLSRAVGQQMIADVPLGAFLSGGIDSSTIVALMQAQSTRPVKTFSIGFREGSFDEAPYARAVAQHLGTEHTELYVTPTDALNLVPRLAALWDEPFADSSQIPTYLVAELARRHVTVALSGDGGDELFAGYARYFAAQERDQEYRRVPGWLQAVLAAAPARLFRAAGRALDLTGVVKPDRNPAYRLHNLSRIYPYDDTAYYWQWFMSHWKQPAQVVLGATEPTTIFGAPQAWVRGRGLIDHLTYLDLAFYLPEDILVKVDRAGMAVSLESRMPLLDHRVVEFSRRLPTEMKIRDGQGKWLLRRLLDKYVPAELVERPKMGFGVPIGDWLRGALRDWAEALLDPSRLRREGIFDAAQIRQTWELHRDGKENRQTLLWDVLMFQQWYDAARAP